MVIPRNISNSIGTFNKNTNLDYFTFTAQFLIDSSK